jgi:hypothetical protein
MRMGIEGSEFALCRIAVFLIEVSRMIRYGVPQQNLCD